MGHNICLLIFNRNYLILSPNNASYLELCLTGPSYSKHCWLLLMHIKSSWLESFAHIFAAKTLNDFLSIIHSKT